MENRIDNGTQEKIPEMLTLKEVSSRTGFSYDFLRKECLKGNIVHIRIGHGKFLINFGLLLEQMNTARGAIGGGRSAE